MGQQEDPASAVTGASLSRREDARLCRVAQLAKVSDDGGKSQIEMAFDVFAEDPLRLDFADDPGNHWPEVSRIGLAASSTCIGERLAGIACSDEMNAAAPWFAVE